MLWLALGPCGLFSAHGSTWMSLARSLRGWRLVIRLTPLLTDLVAFIRSSLLAAHSSCHVLSAPATLPHGNTKLTHVSPPADSAKLFPQLLGDSFVLGSLVGSTSFDVKRFASLAFVSATRGEFPSVRFAPWECRAGGRTLAFSSWLSSGAWPRLSLMLTMRFTTLWRVSESSIPARALLHSHLVPPFINSLFYSLFSTSINDILLKMMMYSVEGIFIWVLFHVSVVSCEISWQTISWQTTNQNGHER